MRDLSKAGCCVALAVLLAAAAGCSSRGGSTETGVTVEELYRTAKRSMSNGSYDRAITLYRQLQSRFPFGQYAEQAQLELAYSYYKNFEPELALSTLNRFVRTYPTHAHVDYAYYLKGLINFSRDRGVLARFLPVEQVGRDQEYARQSFQDFGELVRRFPDSRYAEDARSRMLFLRDAMAQYELRVARYYLRRGAHIAAANRAQYVLENFQGTPQVDDALALLAESYDELSFAGLEGDARRVLEYNYPAHPYLAGEPRGQRQSWLDKLWPF